MTRSLAGPIAVAVLATACGSPPPPPPPVLEAIYSLDVEAAPDLVAATEQAVAVTRKRLERLGIVGARVRGERGRITVELPELAAERVHAAFDVIRERGALELAIVDDGAPYLAEIAAAIAADPSTDVTSGRHTWKDLRGGDHVDTFLRAFDADLTFPIAEAKRIGCWRRHLEETAPEPGVLRCPVTGRQIIARAIAERPPPPTHELVYEHVTPRDERPYWRSHLITRASRVTVVPESAAAARMGDDPTVRVRVTLDTAGTKAFADLTAGPLYRQMTILLDGRVAAAPIINAPVRTGVLWLWVDPKDQPTLLAAVLAGGPLPGPMIQESVQELATHAAAPR